MGYPPGAQHQLLRRQRHQRRGPGVGHVVHVQLWRRVSYSHGRRGRRQHSHPIQPGLQYTKRQRTLRQSRLVGFQHEYDLVLWRLWSRCTRCFCRDLHAPGHDRIRRHLLDRADQRRVRSSRSPSPPTLPTSLTPLGIVNQLFTMIAADSTNQLAPLLRQQQPL